MRNKYLEEIYNDEFSDNEEVIISDDMELLSLAEEYENEIADQFQKGTYSYSLEGKQRCIQDFFKSINITLIFDGDVTIKDLISEIDWSIVEGESIQIIEDLKDFVENIQSFIKDYENTEAFRPDFKQIIAGWIADLQKIGRI